MRRVYAYVSMHAQNSISGIPAVKIFAIFGECFLTFPYVLIKEMFYAKVVGNLVQIIIKNNSHL